MSTVQCVLTRQNPRNIGIIIVGLCGHCAPPVIAVVHSAQRNACHAPEIICFYVFIVYFKTDLSRSVYIYSVEDFEF